MKRVLARVLRAASLGTFFAFLAFAETGADTFAAMHRLVGDWEAKTPSGKTIRVSYRAISRDSALVETFMTAPGVETLTIFHLDGRDLIATHYCAQGNQPRLRLTRQSSNGSWEFVFFDATNLRSADASHLTRLRFRMIGSDQFEKTEIYSQGGKDDETVFKFQRPSAGAK